MLPFLSAPALLAGEKNDVDNPNEAVGLVDVRARQVDDVTLRSKIEEPDHLRTRREGPYKLWRPISSSRRFHAESVGCLR